MLLPAQYELLPAGSQVYRCFLLFLLLIVGLSLTNVSATAADSGRFNSALAGSFLKDSEGTLSFGAVTGRVYEQQFVQNENESFNFRLGQNTYWIRFDAPELTFFGASTWDDIVFYLDYSNIDHADLFVPVTTETPGQKSLLGAGGGIYQRHTLGWVDGPRPINNSYVFPSLDLPAHFDSNRPIYVRLRSDYTLNVRPMLANRTSFAQQQIRLTAFLFVTFGIVAAVILSNVLFYFQMRDPHYSTYAFYAMTLLIYQNGIGGTFFVLGPSWGQFLARSVVVWSHLAMFSGLRFAQAFLQIDTTAPRTARIFWFFQSICVFGAVLGAFNFRYYANWLAYFVGMFGPFLLVATASYVYAQSRRRNAAHDRTQAEQAKQEGLTWMGMAPAITWTAYQVSPYYLAASVMVFVSVLTFVLRGIAVFPHSLVTAYALSGIGAAEALLYSLALSDRLRQLHRDRMQLQEEHSHLTEISLTDDLTRLGNRRAFNQWLLHFVEQPTSAVIMYLDIDYFKTVNDTFGHAQGDKVLKLLAQVMQETVRAEDGCYRIGGEEFVVVLQNIEEAQAYQVAERIRQRFAAVPCIFDGQGVQSTVSIGCSRWYPGESMEKTLLRADQALYQAKEQGRNQVHWSSKEA